MRSFVKQSLIPLPGKLQSKKAIINVQNRVASSSVISSARKPTKNNQKDARKKNTCNHLCYSICSLTCAKTFKTCVYSFKSNFDSAAKDEIFFGRICLSSRRACFLISSISGCGWPDCLFFCRANGAFKFVIFLYFAKYNRKLAVRNVFVCESFRDQVADRVLLSHCECINLFMFRDFFF